MRVLFLSTWFPYPPDNGSKIRVYHLLRALGARHSVTLLSFAFGSVYGLDAAELRQVCEDVQAIECNPFERGQVANALRFLSLTPIVTRPLPKMMQVSVDALARTPFDVVIASTEVMAEYAMAAPPGTARVLEEHNSLSRRMWERYLKQEHFARRLSCWVAWQKARYYEARLFRQFDLCTMVSEQDQAASLQMLYGYRGLVEVVPNGVDCERNQVGLVPHAPSSLVFSGALTYSANLDAMRYFLNDIFPLIRSEVPDASLSITGTTAGVDLTGLPLDSAVHLSGYVDDVRPLVAGASVCVVPLRQGGGTRLKILEAMALGTPVVTTTKGAEGLKVVNGEHLLLADDPITFAARTVQLLCDEAERQQLSANARQLVEQRYDWRPIGQRFTEMVESAALVHTRRDGPVAGGEQ